MNKVTIKKQPFMLNGEIIAKGNKLVFKGINRKNEEATNKEIKGTKIISIFPDINTSICDEQTQKIAKYASENKQIKFISITMDNVETINEWCLAKDIKNVDIWSDSVYKDFGKQTNTLIAEIDKLARGIIILNDDNEIIDISINEEVAEKPNFNIIDKHLN